MPLKITIAYVSARPNPHFEWFVESLVRQTTAEQRANIQLVFVDGCLWSSFANQHEDIEIPFAVSRFQNLVRRDAMADIVRQRFDFLHVPPKPVAWQGPFRQTSKDYFCASNTRNTAFIVAKYPYVACVDDLSVLGPTWFNQVLHAAEGEYVLCGMYKKVTELLVSRSGEIIGYGAYPAGVDSRWDKSSDGGVVPWHGSGLFGCSFGVPLEAALEVDGFDTACNSQGGEDYDFGIRLERANWQFFLNRNALTLESEELHHEGVNATRMRRMVADDRLPKDYEGEKWSDHVILNRLVRETERMHPLVGDGLRELRAHFIDTGCVPRPEPAETDWRDGTPLKDF